jgi:hypothetical protein
MDNRITPPEPVSAFSETLPNLQLAWDSTSLGALKKCPQYYKYHIIDGYTSGQPNAHLEFGTLFHSATELYERLRSTGLDHQKALIDVVRWTILNTWDNETNRPWLSDEPTKTRETLIRTLIWYLDFYKDDRIETITLPNGKPAVEVSFRFPLSGDEHDTSFRTETTGEEFILCGHLDKIGSFNGGHWILDTKTTKYELDDYYFRQYTPDNQMNLYDIAGAVIFNQEIEGVIVNAIQILVNGSRFKRRYINRSPEQREEWLRDLNIWLHQAEIYAVANHWPQNEKGCGYGKGRCQFWGICSTDPSARQELLDGLFVKRPAWNPLETR